MIQKVDGAELRRLLLSAAAAIESGKEKLNELNVFPVPDGDTGTNMSMTINAAATDLRKAEDPTLEKAAREAGGEAMFLECNVLDKSSLERCYDAIMEAYGRIDVLINGAGGNQAAATVPPDKTIFDLDIEAVRQVVDLNLFGTILPTMVFVKAMVEQKSGSIINIASEAALRPLTRVAGYGVAKAAVINWTKYMCGELALKFGEGLRVNAVAPGFLLTNQNRDLLTNPDGSLTPRAETIIAHTPFKRFGEPEELLGTLQWLASDASKFVTGTLTVVDGGFDAFSI